MGKTELVPFDPRDLNGEEILHSMQAAGTGKERYVVFLVIRPDGTKTQWAQRLDTINPRLVPLLPLNAGFENCDLFHSVHPTKHPHLDPEDYKILRHSDARGGLRKAKNISHLASNYIDLDRIKESRSPLSVISVVMGLIATQEFPAPPSFVKLSGRGVWCLWYLRDDKGDSVPNNRVNRDLYLATQYAIYEHFNDALQQVPAGMIEAFNRAFKVDTLKGNQCLTQMTRVPGSVNPKSGKRVGGFIPVTESGTRYYYTQEELAERYCVTTKHFDIARASKKRSDPSSFEVVLGGREKTKRRISISEFEEWRDSLRPGWRRSAADLLRQGGYVKVGPPNSTKVAAGRKRVEYLLQNIEALIRRRGGGFQEGIRGVGAWVYVNAMRGMQLPKTEISGRIFEYCRKCTPSMTNPELKSAIDYQKKYYNFSVNKLIETLGVTKAEQEWLAKQPEVERPWKFTDAVMLTRTDRQAALVQLLAEAGEPRPSLRALVEMLQERFGIRVTRPTVKNYLDEINEESHADAL